MRPPGLVHRQRDAVAVADRGERRDIGCDAVVGRTDDQDALRLRVRRQLAFQLGGRDAVVMSHSVSWSGSRNTGRSPARVSPAITDRWQLRATSTVSPGRAMQRKATWLLRLVPL